jgi:hypothetical protein
MPALFDQDVDRPDLNFDPAHRSGDREPVIAASKGSTSIFKPFRSATSRRLRRARLVRAVQDDLRPGLTQPAARPKPIPLRSRSQARAGL